MSIANILYKLAGASLPVVAKTVTATLTAAEMKGGAINAVHASTPVALTLPAAVSAGSARAAIPLLSRRARRLWSGPMGHTGTRSTTNRPHKRTGSRVKEDT